VFEDQAVANAAAKKRQRILLYSAVGVCGIGAAVILLGHPGSPASQQPGQTATSPGGHGPTAMPINTDSMTAASLAESNYRATSENRMDSLENRLKADQARDGKLAQLEQELQEIKQGHAGTPASGQGTANPQLAAKDAELSALRAQIAELKKGGGPKGFGSAVPPAVPGNPVPAVGVAGAGLPGRPSASASMVKVDSYGSSAASKPAERTSLLFADSPDYLPPNSIATARVIVGADAQAAWIDGICQPVDAQGSLAPDDHRHGQGWRDRRVPGISGQQHGGVQDSVGRGDRPEHPTAQCRDRSAAV
jgi:conjugal transfer pilus assembly protein TraB